MARVWKAHDELLNRTVALKILDEKLARSDNSRRRFLHDAQAAAALSHPGVIAVHDYGQADETVFIALAFIDGETVSALASRRLMPFDEVARIGIAAADALAHAHERGVIHRDVTGRNLMVARDGRVIMLDFGLALAAWESRVTTTQTAMGTALYMAPELWNSADADARSDIYGLGVVLYEMLTGTFPFDQPQTVPYASVNLPAVPLRDRRPDVPADLEAVVNRAIARDPAARFATAAEVAAALRAVTLAAPARDGEQTVHARDVAARPADGNGSRADTRQVSRAPLYLAVLPFECESAEGADDASSTVTRRLDETIRIALAGVPTVRVVSPVSGTLPSEPREAARVLGANALLRGSVRRSGSRLRVQYSVLDPWEGIELFGDRIDGSALQPFDVEDHVAASVTRAIAAGGPAIAAPRRPSDPLARERFQQAQGYLNRYFNEASVDGALRILEALVASDPENARFHAALVRACLYKYGHVQQSHWQSRAAAACARALEIDAGDAAVLAARGYLRITSGQPEPALQDFHAALAAEPASFDAQLGVARAHWSLEHMAEAQAACARAISMQPEEWRGHNLLGLIALRRGEYVAAENAFRKVLSITPDNALGWRNLGSALFRQDRFEDAESAYRASLSHQAHGDAFSFLGTALYYLRRDDEAIEAMRKAADLTPSDPTRWGNLGNALTHIPGQRDRAKEPLDLAITLMRERLDREGIDAESWSKLAGWLANRGRQGEAREAIDQALRIAPRNIEVMVRAGHVFFQLGERTSCLLWLRRARAAGFRAGELKRSRELAPLWDDTEFRQLLEDPPPEAWRADE